MSGGESITAIVRTFADIPDTEEFAKEREEYYRKRSEEGLPWTEVDSSEITNTTNSMESESMSNEPTRDSHSPNGIEIHSNIPVPSSVGVRGVRSRYPLMEMEVGDCFFVECDRSDEGKLEERTIRQTVSRYHRRLADGNFGLAKKHSVPDDARWAVSRQDDNRVGVWRLA